MLKIVVGLGMSYHAGLPEGKPYCLAVKFSVPGLLYRAKLMFLTYKGEDTDLKGQKWDKSKTEQVVQESAPLGAAS